MHLQTTNTMASIDNSRKRPLQEDEAPKKKRRKGPKGVRREEEGDLDVEAGLNKAFEKMDSQLVADHVAQRTNRFGNRPELCRAR